MDHQFKDFKNQKKPVSVLQGDGYCTSKILARESSVGQSSRIYYCSTNEGVPFKWEMEPGTPKSRPPEEVIPPPTPPPAVQSLGLPKPSVDQHTKVSRRARFWFWMRSMIIRQENQKAQGGKCNHVSSSDEFERFYNEFGVSDGELTASANDSRSSSASSSSSNCDPRLRRGVPLFCGPWQQH